MNDIANKKYIKKYIIRAFTGKVGQEEAQKVKKALINYNREEWKLVKVSLKEFSKESVSDLINSSGDEIPGEWREEVKNFFDSLINFAFTIGNENLLYGSMQVLKQSNLTLEQQARKILFLILPEVKKVTDKFNHKVADYHKTEETLAKKMKSFFEVYWKFSRGGLERKEALSKFMEIAKNLSADEIIVLKKKLKAFVIKALGMKDTQNLALFGKLSKASEAIKPLLDLVDVILDENLVKEVIDVLFRSKKKYDENPEFYKKLKPAELAKDLGLEQEGKKLLVSLTNHLNKLAGEGTGGEDIPIGESQEMLTRVLTNIKDEVEKPADNPNPLPPTPNEDPWDISKDLIDAFAKFSSDEKLQNSLIKEIGNYLTKVESKGKWYENPWKFGLASLGVTMAVAFLVWLFLGRKKSRSNYN